MTTSTTAPQLPVHTGKPHSDKRLRRRSPKGRTILVIAEGATLSHVGRPLMIAKALALAGYEVVLAFDQRFLPFIDAGSLRVVPITSIDGAKFLNRIVGGKPMFTARELNDAIEEDIRLLKDIRPAIVIGDMRWSLAVSARTCKVPYVAISNAYWSPYSAQTKWVLPAHPIAQYFGFAAMQLVFKLFRPVVFGMMALPSNHVRWRHGMPSIGWDMRRVNEDADYVWFPDMPALHPTRDLPHTHHYIGPIHWAPAVPLPEWWTNLRTDLPVVYVNLGSSGHVGLLPMILEELSRLPLQIIAATAGRSHIAPLAPNVFLADYLPGDACMKRAALAVTNGGSMSGYQALEHGTPVLGIASHLDQSLSMQPVAAAGAGLMLCSPYVTPKVLVTSVRRMLDDPSFRHRAQQLQQSVAAMPAAANLPGLVNAILA
jgi:UDP:flavonoid glycosyltransferase YjiC (YdhE family)